MKSLSSLSLTVVAGLSFSQMAGAALLEIGYGETVPLTPGTYRFDRLVIHGGGTLDLSGNTTLIVDGNVEIHNDWVLPDGTLFHGSNPPTSPYGEPPMKIPGTLYASGSGGSYGTSTGSPYGSALGSVRGRFAYWDDAGNIWQASAGVDGQKGPDGGAGGAGTGGYRVNINAGGDIRIDGVVRATGGSSGGWGGDGTAGQPGGGGGYNATWTVPPWLATEQNPYVKEDALRRLGQGAPGGRGGDGGAGGAGGDGADGTALAFNAKGDVVLGPSSVIYTSGALGGRGGRGGNGANGGKGGYSVESNLSYGAADVRRLRLNGADGGDGANGGAGGAGGAGGEGGSLFLQGRTVDIQGAIYQDGGRGGWGGAGGWGGDGRDGGNSNCCLPNPSSSLSLGSGSGGAGGDGGDGGDGGNGGNGGDGGNVYVRAFAFVNGGTIRQQGGDGGSGGTGGNAGAGGPGGYGLNLSQDPLHGSTYSDTSGGTGATPVQSRSGFDGAPGRDGSPGANGRDGGVYALTAGSLPFFNFPIPDVLLNFRQSGNPNGKAEVVRVGGNSRIQLTVDSIGDVSPFSLEQLVLIDNIPKHFEFGYRWLDTSPNGALEFTLNDVTLFRIDHDGTPEGTVSSPLGLNYFLVDDSDNPGFSIIGFDLPSLSSLPAELVSALGGDSIASFAIDLYPGSPVGIQFSQITTPTVTSVVPVPPAVWLFGSGLLGMLLAGRRRA